MPTELLQSDLPLPVRRGKVRDVYDLGDALLIVATDRISAFDCVMPNGIPGKGKILTALRIGAIRHGCDAILLNEPASRSRCPAAARVRWCLSRCPS